MSYFIKPICGKGKYFHFYFFIYFIKKYIQILKKSYQQPAIPETFRLKNTETSAEMLKKTALY